MPPRYGGTLIFSFVGSALFGGFKILSLNILDFLKKSEYIFGYVDFFIGRGGGGVITKLG